MLRTGTHVDPMTPQTPTFSPTPKHAKLNDQQFAFNFLLQYLTGGLSQIRSKPVSGPKSEPLCVVKFRVPSDLNNDFCLVNLKHNG